MEGFHVGLVAELSFLLGAKATVVSDYLLEQSVSTTVQRFLRLRIHTHIHTPRERIAHIYPWLA